MKGYIARFFESKLRTNTLGLLVAQLGTYFVPLVLTPYLARTLGVTAFGALALCGGLVAMFAVIVDWGFALSGPAKLAKHRHDIEKCSEIFWEVNAAKFVLFLVAVVGLAPVLLLYSPVEEYQWVVIAAFAQLIGNTISAGWFLQGLERMAKVAVLGLVIRLATIPLTILCVKSADDLVLAALIQSAAAIAVAVLGFCLARDQGLIRRANKISLEEVALQIKESFSLFLSFGSMALFTYSNTLILASMSNINQLSFFSAAERVQRAGQGILNPLSSAFFPRISHLAINDLASARALIVRLLWLQVGSAAVLAMAIAAAAPFIVYALLGSQYAESINVLRVLTLVILFGAVSNCFGVNVLIPFGSRATFTSILMIGGVFNIILLIALVPSYGALGGAFAVATTEFAIMIMMITAAYHQVYLSRE